MKNILIILGVIVIAVVGYLLLNDTQTPTTTYTDEITTYSSDEASLTTRHSDSGEMVQLLYAGETYELERTRSASGAKFQNDDASVVFWEHGGEAMLEIDGEIIVENATTASTEQEPVIFSTSEEEFTITYSDNADTATLAYGGEKYELERARSGSGARYASVDGSVVFWEHQGEAMIEIDGQTMIEGAEVADDKAKGETDNKLPAGTVSIGGTLDSVSTACFADGVCTATVEGKTIVLIEGWSSEVVGEVRFEDGIGGLEQHIGKPVFVFAAETDEGYTLYGSEDYYIEPAI